MHFLTQWAKATVAISVGIVVALIMCSVGSYLGTFPAPWDVIAVLAFVAVCAGAFWAFLLSLK